MKALLVIVGLAAIGLIFYPQISENSRGPCHALEKRVARSFPTHPTNSAADVAIGRTFLGALIGELSDGGLAAAYVQQRHPNMPPLLGCAAIYWQIFLDPAVGTRLARESGLTF